MTMPAHRPPPPESRGPGTDDASGTVIYGADSGVRAFVPPPRPVEDREADRLAARERAACQFCEGVPAGLLAEICKAVTEAHRKGREGRPL